jgi:hypothetical protein
MTSTMPGLGWMATLAMLAFIAACVAGIVLYHVWLDRRLRRERATRASLGGEPTTMMRQTRAPRRDG